VRYYIAAVNFAAATGDASELRSLATAGCVSCKAIARTIKRIYGAGGSITSRGWVVRSVSPVPLQPRARPIFDLGVFETPQEVHRSAASTGKHYEGGKQPMTIHLRITNSGWKVSRLDLVS
jgi:hypothetical protein